MTTDVTADVLTQEILVALNLCYAAGMLDYPFAMGWIRSGM